MIKALICTINLLLFTSYCIGQNRIDSLVNSDYNKRDTILFDNYSQIIKHYLYEDKEIARDYIDKLIVLARELKDPDKDAFARNADAVYYASTNQYAKALAIHEVNIKYYKKVNNLERVSAMLNNIAICNRRLGDIELSLENQLKSVAIKEEIKAGPAAIAASYWNIGNIHYDIKNYSLSSNYYRKAQVLYEQLNEEKDVVILSSMIASNYTAMNDSLDYAKDLFLKNIEYYKKENLPNEVAGGYSDLAGISMKEKDYKTAEEYYLLALPIAENNGEKAFPGILYRRLAKINRINGNNEVALNYANKALSNSKELDLNKKIIFDYKELALTHNEIGNYKEAFDNYLLYDAMQDSILSNEKILAINDLEEKYQAEKKQQEIILLEEKAKRNKLRQNGLIAGIIGLFILFTSIFYALRQKLKRNKITEEKLNQEMEFKSSELEFKKQELMAFALQLASKNETLEGIREDIEKVKNNDKSRSLQNIINTINLNKNDDSSWDNFRKRFEELHVNFEQEIKNKYPGVSSNELRLMALMKMNLSSKEMANILNISMDGIKKARYRLRKKLGLESIDSLEDTILAL